MTAQVLAQEASGTSLASWTPLTVLMCGYGAIVALLLTFGRARRPTNGVTDVVLARISAGLTAVTGLPGWACAAAGTALFGLLVAGIGFYDDVSWHIALGRDEELFTAPHTAIVVGLAFLLFGGVLGTLLATADGAKVGARVGALRVPWSCTVLMVLGVSALCGFPLDEVWHSEYGIDVTMWSPTHMLMILGASFSGMASWLVFAEAGVDARRGGWARGVHVLAAWLTLQGLTASLGEFSFGVPQFQQLFHPLIVTIAAAFGLVAARIVLGPGWALGLALLNVALRILAIPGIDNDGTMVETRETGLFVVSAIVVEAVAWLVGPGRSSRRRLRFAVLAGLGVATLGLAGEFAYNADAHQPWTSALLPDAVVLAAVVGVGAAVLAAAFARVVAGEPPDRALPRWSIAAAGAMCLVALALPMPRHVGDVHADLRLEPAAPGQVIAEVTLTPADAADDARWFQAMSWQGGGLDVADMVEVEPGRWVAEGPVSIEGRAKALVRLHRHDELMAVPIRLPADPEIGATAVPAEDRSLAFAGEKQFLMRESEPGSPWLERAVYVLLAGVGIAWATAFGLACRRIGGGPAPARARRVPAGTPG